MSGRNGTVGARSAFQFITHSLNHSSMTTDHDGIRPAGHSSLSTCKLIAIHVVVENSRSRSLVFLWSRFVAKRYILEQKCQKGRIGTWMLGSRWNNFQPSTPTLRATMHSVTDIQTDGRTDGQQAYANSRSYCVAVRSAKKCAITTYNNNSAKLKQQCYWCQTELER